MKAKLLIIVTLIVSSFSDVFSQEYHSFLNDSAWIINDWVSCCRPPEERVINLGTDVEIGAYTYKQFNDPFPSYDSATNSYINTIYIREDKLERKVYKIVNGVDMLLYDFSLENGDTITQYGNTFVATVDEINVHHGERKRITLHSIEQYCGQSLTQVWIEGVGSNKHPFYPEYNMYNVCSSGGGYTIFTKCSFQNGNCVYGNNCSMPGLGVDENLATNKIEFYPNPFSTQFTISNNTDFENMSFKLYNSVGQIVSEKANLSGKTITINRDNLATGIYLIQLFQDGKLLKSNKLVISN